MSKNPLELKFTFAFWTSRMVRELIRRKYGIRLSKAWVCRLLKQLGLTLQRPLWRTYQQGPEDVRRQLQQECPEIRALAQSVNARLFLADEAGVRSDHHAGTTWAPKGRTPVVRSTRARFGLNMISAVSHKDHLGFMVIEGNVANNRLCEFIRRLVYNSSRPIFLIVDGHPVHLCAWVKRFVQSLSGKIELFFLRPDCPELNADEHVWNDLKNDRIGRIAVSIGREMKQKVVGHLKGMQRMPELISSFFRAPTSSYARRYVYLLIN